MMMRVYASLGGVIVIALIIWGVVALNHHATPVAAETSPSASGTAGSPATLQSTDEVVGTGAEAVAGKTLSVSYTGTLTDGTVFDSTSKDGGQPFSFVLGAGQVIKGWDQGVVGMKVGGTRKLVIPASLGYGAQANGAIPANSTLIFVIQLLSVN